MTKIEFNPMGKSADDEDLQLVSYVGLLFQSRNPHLVKYQSILSFVFFLATTINVFSFARKLRK